MAALPTVVTIERSEAEATLDQKIVAANARATVARSRREGRRIELGEDPWQKFRASLSMGRGLRTL